MGAFLVDRISNVWTNEQLTFTLDSITKSLRAVGIEDDPKGMAWDKESGDLFLDFEARYRDRVPNFYRHLFKEFGIRAGNPYLVE